MWQVDEGIHFLFFTLSNLLNLTIVVDLTVGRWYVCVRRGLCCLQTEISLGLYTINSFQIGGIVFRRIAHFIQESAVKSLAQPTSWCHRTESIVSLERGVCSCAKLQVFLVTEDERKHVRWRAWFQQHRDANCHQVFFPCKARRWTKFTPFWQKH